MANGYERADWTVEMSGRSEGTISCGAYQAQFSVSDLGSIQIVWPPMESVGDVRTLQRVAREVVEHAMQHLA